MRCLILGGDGMLGHQLLLHLSDHDLRVTIRGSLDKCCSTRLSHHNTYDHVDVRDMQHVIDVFADFRPEVVVNAAGIIKQRSAAQAVLPCLEVNALFPHRLLALCTATAARLIHISTDCVFSGKRGNYAEQDPADADDLYGRSKLLGEIALAPGITLRTSIIGLELKNHFGLIEWYLRQRGAIHGFRGAIYSGLTTAELARVIRRLIEHHSTLAGVWHVASDHISKYELLAKLSERLKRRDLEIIPDDEFKCDRSLNGAAFRNRVEYRAPSWDVMLDELASQIQQRMRGSIYHDAA